MVRSLSGGGLYDYVKQVLPWVNNDEKFFMVNKDYTLTLVLFNLDNKWEFSHGDGTTKFSRDLTNPIETFPP